MSTTDQTSNEDDSVQSESTPPSPIRHSAWTTRQNIARAIWMAFAKPVWKYFPSMRVPLLRLFGARIGKNCRFASTSEVTIPWNLVMGDDCDIGHRVLLYNLGVISLGDGVVIDYHAHLCAGTHDFTDPRFPLLTPPITIGARTFIGIDSYLAPGVTLGADCRVWPRSSLYRSFPDSTVIQGNPARAVTELRPPVGSTSEEQLNAGG